MLTLTELLSSRAIEAAVKACARLAGLTEDTEVRFGWRDTTDAEVRFDPCQNAVEISHAWLDSHLMHKRFPCQEMNPRDTLDDDTRFLCDHIIEELLRAFLASVFKPIPLDRATENRILRNIRQMLRHKPHGVKTIQSAEAELTVIWKDNANRSSRTSMRSQAVYHVVLHKEKCHSGEVDLLHKDAGGFSNEKSLCLPWVTCQSC